MFNISSKDISLTGNLWQALGEISDVFKGDMDPTLFEKPGCLDEMLKYAEILSKPFPFVRVDFYEVKGKIYFGELTFTPTGCLATYYTDKAELELGELLDVNGNP